MNDSILRLSAQEAFDNTGIDYEGFRAALAVSLKPRSPSILFDKLAPLIAKAGADKPSVLDAGCRNAAYSIEIAQRFDCHVTGVDIVELCVQQAKQKISQSHLDDLVSVEQGDIQSLRFADESFDVIWCRDTLSLIPDLPKAFSEFARVLKPSGHVLIYNTFATDLMEPAEAEMLYSPMRVVSANMSVDYFENALDGADFSIVERDDIDSEWRERWEEEGDSKTSKQLLWIARMNRSRERLIERFGRKAFEIELADSRWGVYQMLGKLSPKIYVLQNGGK